MHGLKSTIVLLVILGGLVGYIYFVDANREDTDPNAKPKVFELSSENIEELQFRNATGDAARVQRVDANWQLVEPDKADADAGVVGTVTSNLASLEVQRVVDENPGDLAQYGLNPPRIDVAFRVRDQKDFQRLLVGEKTPTGGDVYAKRPDENRVFLISSYLESIFNKTPFELRDKVVLKFEREKTDGIEVVTGPATVQFARNGTDWRIVKPLAVRADYAAVEGLMTRLSSTHMQKVVASDAGDLRQYGLDRPTLSATVTSGSSRATLLLGRAAPDEPPAAAAAPGAPPVVPPAESIFAKDSSRPMVFTVEQNLVTDLRKDIGEFRRKDMFDARSFTANRIELRRSTETLTLEKTEADGKEAWRNAASQNVDTTKVEDLLSKLSNLRAQSFEAGAHASLNMPLLTATVGFDDKKTETVTFGRSGTDVFASRADEPGTARIESMAFDEAIKAVDALK